MNYKSETVHPYWRGREGGMVKGMWKRIEFKQVTWTQVKSTHWSTGLSIYWSICISTGLPMCLSVFLLVYLWVYLSNWVAFPSSPDCSHRNYELLGVIVFLETFFPIFWPHCKYGNASQPRQGFWKDPPWDLNLWHEERICSYDFWGRFSKAHVAFRLPDTLKSLGA